MVLSCAVSMRRAWAAMTAVLLVVALVSDGHAQQQQQEEQQKLEQQKLAQQKAEQQKLEQQKQQANAPAQPTPAIEAPQAFADAAVGDEITGRGANLADKKIVVTLRTPDGKRLDAAVVRIAAGEFVFKIPETPLGRYHVLTKVLDAQEQYSGDLRVVAAQPVIHRIIAISPWSKLLGGRFDFEIVGDRLPAAAPCPSEPGAQCLTLILDDERLNLKRCTAPPRPLPAAAAPARTPPVAHAGGAGTATNPTVSTTPPSPVPTPACAQLADSDLLDQDKDGRPEPCFWPGRSEQRVCVHGLTTRTDGGARTLQVSASGRLSAPVSLHVSRFTPRTIKWASFGFFVMLCAGLLVLGRQVRESAAANSSRLRLLSWMLLDEQTNSFSLSKLQLLLWAAVIIYCYVYFFLASVYVQGNLDFPPLPKNFGWLLGVTGGTTAMTTALTRMRGSNGAGAAMPAPSDLVSTGGVLAPDRLQFLAWTIIGCIGYLMLVLKAQPELLTLLPELKPELVSIMGVSALVYLGGKAVRLPGPIVNECAATLNANKDELTLKVKGQNLHKDAVVSIDGAAVGADRTPSGSTAGAVDPSLVPELTLTIKGSNWNTGDHSLRLTNLDGQFAEVWFAVDAPEMTNIADSTTADQITASAAAVAVSVTGKNLRSGSSAEWLPPGATAATVIPAAHVVVATDNKSAKVTLTPGVAKGAARLTLVSPSSGIRAVRPVTVG